MQKTEKKGNHKISLHGRCLTVEKAQNNLQLDKASAEKKEIIFVPCLQNQSHTCSRKGTDQTSLGKLS